MAATFDVILPGSYFCDLIFTGLPSLPVLGKEIFGDGFDILPGGTYNTAFALHRLGLKPGWVTDFGSDFFSQFVLRAARKAGLDDALFRFHDFPLQSVSAALSFPQDRAFISYIDPYDPPLPIAEVLQFKPPCLLVPFLCTGGEATTLFATARQQGTWIYMDCQATEKTLDDGDVCQAIRSVDIFAPNAREAMHLTGENTVEGALDCLSELAPLVIIKQGSEGVIARFAHDLETGSGNRQTLSVPAIPVKVVDTTGAGDCFNAGFIYARIKGRPITACLQAGNLCGGLSTTARGCQAAPTARDLEKRLKKSGSQQFLSKNPDR